VLSVKLLDEVIASLSYLSIYLPPLSLSLLSQNSNLKESTLGDGFEEIGKSKKSDRQKYRNMIVKVKIKDKVRVEPKQFGKSLKAVRLLPDFF